MPRKITIKELHRKLYKQNFESSEWCAKIHQIKIKKQEHYCQNSWYVSLPVYTFYAVFEGHQKPLPHRKLHVSHLSDDQHVRTGKVRTEVVQVDPAVIRHQTHTEIWRSVSCLSTNPPPKKTTKNNDQTWCFQTGSKTTDNVKVFISFEFFLFVKLL